MTIANWLNVCSAVNNFSKDEVDETNENSNLEQAKDAISQAKGNLDLIVKMLEPAAWSLLLDKPMLLLEMLRCRDFEEHSNGKACIALIAKRKSLES